MNEENKVEINIGILMEKVTTIKETVDEIRQWIKDSDKRFATKEDLQNVQNELDLYKKGLLGALSAIVVWVLNSLLGLIKNG